MARSKKRYCKFCQREFIPDPRTCKRQKYCKRPKCQARAKQLRQRRWVAKNPGYFRGLVNVQRVRKWRAANPNYWRARRQRAWLQDAVRSQVLGADEFLTLSTQAALQESLEQRMRALVQLGHILFAGEEGSNGLGIDTAPTAVHADQPVPMAGVIFIDPSCLPGALIDEYTFRCGGTLLKVLPR